jgi:hypothetical protein
MKKGIFTGVLLAAVVALGPTLAHARDFSKNVVRRNSQGGISVGSVQGHRGARVRTGSAGGLRTDGQRNVEGANVRGIHTSQGQTGWQKRSWTRSADGSLERNSARTVSGRKGTRHSSSRLSRDAGGHSSRSYERTATGRRGATYAGTTTYAQGTGFDRETTKTNRTGITSHSTTSYRRETGFSHSRDCTDASGALVPCR